MDVGVEDRYDSMIWFRWKYQTYRDGRKFSFFRNTDMHPKMGIVG